MRNAARFGVLLFGLAVAVAGYGAGCGSDNGNGGGFGDVDASNGDAQSDVGNIDFDANHGAAKSLVIEPADAVVDVTNLAMLPTKALTAKVTFADNTTSATPASWTIDRLDIATIGAGTGVVTATGGTFGKANVTSLQTIRPLPCLNPSLQWLHR